MAENEQATTPEETATAEVTPIAPTPPTPQYVTQEQFKAVEQALTTVAQHLATAMPARQAAPAPKSPEEISDEDLWSAAQQGNRQAFEMYQGRIARREFQTQYAQKTHDQTVLGQLTALYQKYPELGDPQHPLTQRAMAFKSALVQLGEPVQSRKTDLDAILRAVADSRDLISPKTASPTRQATPTGQMGAMHRQAETPEKAEDVKLTPDEGKLAKQMGVKDPRKAVKKFWERNENGTSRVSPNIAAAIDRQ